MRITKVAVSASDQGRVSCDALGPQVGSIRLLKRILDDYGDEIWAPRDISILNALLSTHYQFPVDVTCKLEGLHSIARALTKGDITHAHFVTLFLQFPELSHSLGRTDASDIALLESLYWSGLLKADDDWNSKHPRTGKPPNRGWFDSVPKEPKLPVPGESRKWPLKEANQHARDWEKKNPSPRMPSHAARLELIAVLIKELSKMGLNEGEDLITAQLYASYDPPKTLDELRQRPEQYSASYERHHIVEQNAANRAKFGDAMIDDPDNLVWVPRLKHEKITANYNSKVSDGGPSFRETLSDLDFESQKQIGLKELRDVGVLK